MDVAARLRIRVDLKHAAVVSDWSANQASYSRCVWRMPRPLSLWSNLKCVAICRLLNSARFTRYAVFRSELPVTSSTSGWCRCSRSTCRGSDGNVRHDRNGRRIAWLQLLFEKTKLSRGAQNSAVHVSQSALDLNTTNSKSIFTFAPSGKRRNGNEIFRLEWARAVIIEQA